MKKNKPVDISTGEFLFGRTDFIFDFGPAVSKEITIHCFLDLILPGYHRSGSKRSRMQNSARSHRCYIKCWGTGDNVQ
jgi:hypothetical protein